eukprot:6190128-Pleurochrysis_carterae.AAC.2
MRTADFTSPSFVCGRPTKSTKDIRFRIHILLSASTISGQKERDSSTCELQKCSQHLAIFAREHDLTVAFVSVHACSDSVGRNPDGVTHRVAAIARSSLQQWMQSDRAIICMLHANRTCSTAKRKCCGSGAGPPARIHAHAHAQAHVSTYQHTPVHTRAHTRAHTHAHTHAHNHAHAHAHAHAHTHTHSNTQSTRAQAVCRVGSRTGATFAVAYIP